MNLMDHKEPKNAEGYCPKCGMDLGITGICYICALKELPHKCGICGRDMKADDDDLLYRCTPRCEEIKRRLYEI